MKYSELGLEGIKYFWLEFMYVPTGKKTYAFVVRATDLNEAKMIIKKHFEDRDFEIEKIKIHDEYFRYILENLAYEDDVANIYI